MTRFALHALTLAVFLGGPWLHGYVRAKRMQRTFAEAASCFYGGTPTEQPGLGEVPNPSGRYAAAFFDRVQGWPVSCELVLKDLAEDPALLLFPSVKAAEADIQRAAQLVLQELDAVVAGSPDSSARLPVRPLWAMRMLQSAVRAHAQRVGLIDVSVASPVSFEDDAGGLPTPSLLSIDAARDASVDVWGSDSQLQAFAHDASGISFMRLTSEDTTRVRLPRDGGLGGLIRGGDLSYLVWRTPAERCGFDRCAGKSVGLAAAPMPLTRIPAPRWVQGHPIGSLARSLAFVGNRFWMAAANSTGRARLIEFQLPDALGPEQARDMPPIPVREIGPTHAADLVVFRAGSFELGALYLERNGARWQLSLFTELEGSRQVASIPARDAPGWIAHCSVAGRSRMHAFAVGNGDHMVLGYARADGAVTWPAQSARVALPMGSDPARGDVQLVCTDDGSVMALIEEAGQLRAVSCRSQESDCASHDVAAPVADFSALATGNDVLVAFAGQDAPQVRVRKLDSRGAPTENARIPAPCWARWGGMCGGPVLARLGSRVVLAARSGRSLMAVESPDDGAHWRELGAHILIDTLPPHVPPRAVRSQL